MRKQPVRCEELLISATAAAAAAQALLIKQVVPAAFAGAAAAGTSVSVTTDAPAELAATALLPAGGTTVKLHVNLAVTRLLGRLAVTSRPVSPCAHPSASAVSAVRYVGAPQPQRVLNQHYWHLRHTLFR